MFHVVKQVIGIGFAVLLLSCLASFSVNAQTSAFTYQGRLTDGGVPANGTYDLQFKLFDTSTTGTGAQQGPTVTNATVSVSSGAFTVQLDFGAGVFSGLPRFLEIGVRHAGDSNPYNVLSPRQPVTATPYAVRSLNSTVADVLSSSCVGCVTSTQVGSVSGAVVSGTIPLASVPAGSGDYVQNTNSPQAATNFNVSGNGTLGGTLSANSANVTNTASANIINATTQFNIGGTRILSTPGTRNLFLGFGAGTVNNTGFSNSFFGFNAGLVNTTACCNSFFGSTAGKANTTGTFNSFFGQGAGGNNVTGNSNAFFGTGAGVNTNSNFNSFFGSESGSTNTTGFGNSFFGERTGFVNTSGFGNSFFGVEAGINNTTGTDNTFVGESVGATNVTGSNNTLIGAHTDVKDFALNQISNSTAIGFGAVVDISNRIVLGTASNDVSIPGLFLRVAGGITAKKYDINSATVLQSPDDSSNTLLGKSANVGSSNLTFATAIGSEAVVNNSNSVVLGRTSDTVRVPGGLVVTGSASVNSGMLVSGNAVFGNNVSVGTLGSAGSTSLCRNGSNQIAACSSSLRYKTNVHPFSSGLNVIRQLRPITFNWKEGGIQDVGFAAEEVNRVAPLLATTNDKGEIEGVKYGQLTTVLVNAVNEQQAQIAAQQRKIEQQQQQLKRQQNLLESLKLMVCQQHKSASVCK